MGTKQNAGAANHGSHRGSIFVEEARVLSQEAFAAEQFALRIHAPRCAAAATPGTFVHVQCDPLLPMRRPLSIMRCSPKEGWIELLYKTVGSGTRLLARRKRGDVLSTLGPIGSGFVAHRQRPEALLLGGGVGIPPMIFLAEQMQRTRTGHRPLLLMGSEVPFPFATVPSRLPVPGIVQRATAAASAMEQLGIPSRLASLQDYPGCAHGFVTDLARAWLEDVEKTTLAQVEIFACGPQQMLRAVARLAREYDLPCQVSLEEYMACAIGGCAGCTVAVETAAGPAMKRVCVDGPVFNAADVFAH